MVSMTLLFTLPIFPEGSLASSVVTTVWIGVFVSVMLNLRLGWCLSGLVVPGYMVPLIIMKPVSALVVFGEGAIAYGIVWFCSEYTSRSRWWSNCFGRDRFFALILASIAVRICLDGYLLPRIARSVSAPWLNDFDFASNLQSFGLIIIALIANQFWKPGLRRGLVPVGVTLGITYLIVRYPLMEWTNFNIGRLEFMYEDVSASVFSSPKAYIILVCTAFIASRLNLRYSWEFNGIMIPSLLALQWFQPFKILTSFIEAWMIYGVAILVLRIPIFREMTIEGGRKILLFFNISFFYKLLLGHLLAWAAPDIQVTDCYGFGYLLPSLLAVKMHDKGIPERITRTTLQASFVGIAGATAVGFGLTFVPQGWLWEPPAAEAALLETTPHAAKNLVEQLREDKIEMYSPVLLRGADPSPMQREVDAFKRGLHGLRSYGMRGDESQVRRARLSLRAAGFELLNMEGDLFYIRELPPKLGRGIYVVRSSPDNRLAVEIPLPLQEWATLEAGAYLFGFLDAGSLAVSTLPRRRSIDEHLGVLDDRRTFFHAFHQVFGLRDAIQVRGYSTKFFRECATRWNFKDTDLDEVPSSLWVQSELPESVSLASLRSFLGGIAVEWEAAPFRNVHREANRGGFAELYLRREDRKRLLGRFVLGDDAFGLENARDFGLVPEEIDGKASLQAWVLSLADRLGPRGSNLYRAPTQETLLFLDEEVLRPLVRLVVGTRDASFTARDVTTELPAIHAAATALGYRVLRYRSRQEGEEYVILTEAEPAEPRRYWGTYAFRLWGHAPYAVEIPRPGYERNTLEYGTSLFDKLRGAFLLVAGTHPKCNTDSTSDMVQAQNKRSLFNLVNQVLLRETRTAPLAVVQVRAFGHKPGAVLPEGDALISFQDGSASDDELSQLSEGLMKTFEDDRLDVRFVDGSPETTGYEAHSSAQARYLTHTVNKELAALWLSPYTRVGYRQESDSEREEAQFLVLGVSTVRNPLDRQLLAAESFAELPEQMRGILLRILSKYQVTKDVNVLRGLETRLPDLVVTRVIDPQSRKSFLVLRREGRILPLVGRIALHRSSFLSSQRHFRPDEGESLTAEHVRRFVESTSAFLEWGEEP